METEVPAKGRWERGDWYRMAAVTVLVVGSWAAIGLGSGAVERVWLVSWGLVLVTPVAVIGILTRFRPENFVVRSSVCCFLFLCTGPILPADLYLLARGEPVEAVAGQASCNSSKGRCSAWEQPLYRLDGGKVPGMLRLSESREIDSRVKVTIDEAGLFDPRLTTSLRPQLKDLLVPAAALPWLGFTIALVSMRGRRRRALEAGTPLPDPTPWWRPGVS